MTPPSRNDIAASRRRRSSWRWLGAVTAICWAAVGSIHAGGSAESGGGGISVSWELLENIPDGHFNCALTLHNKGVAALSGDWSLHFNSASKLELGSAKSDFVLSHINGDFYLLRPKNGTDPIEFGGKRVIALRGSPWAINVSDAPSGFYFVPSRQSTSAGPIAVPIRLQPFPPAAKLRRGADDRLPVVTAETRYRENELLTKIPSDQLARVVPTPMKISSTDGTFLLTPSTTIFYEPTLAGEAKLLANQLDELLVGHVEIVENIPDKAPRGSIQLRSAATKSAESATKGEREGYTLTITPDCIEILGADPAGVFYASQTLRSLLPIKAFRRRNKEVSIDSVKVVDAPRFRYRGLHLDVARNFQSKQTVEKLLDLMAFYKLNRLHLHLTDDEGWRIEIRQLPELTKVGSRRGQTLDESAWLIPSQGSGSSPDAKSSPGTGYYSQDDFVEILRFAGQRHITVVPEIDLPGHARAAVKSMEARRRKLLAQGKADQANAFSLQDPDDKSKYESVQLWCDNVVDVGRESTYQFLDVVIGELQEIYKRAGVPLKCVHLGGDEVPKGAWEKSPACERLATDADSTISRTNQLEMYFLNRACKLLQGDSIQAACWEDCLLLEGDRDTAAGDHLRASGKPTPTAYVWNNVWGWGREDAAYRLANAGFDVVLCNATHLYFDLACEKDPLEPGYYWAGFVGMRAPFEFIPLDVFKNAAHTNMGHPIDEKTHSNRTRLTPTGTNHILGIQGQLWGENVRSPKSLEYMAFPRVIALAERAWAGSPSWAQIPDPIARSVGMQRDWNQFANRLGQRELPRLDFLSGGVLYRLPPPGAVVRDGRVSANVAFPGIAIRYTNDGTEPDLTASPYQEPIPLSSKIKLRSFDTRGRSSRTVNVGLHD
jgi:hexosaminidase